MDYSEAIPQARAGFSRPVEGLQFARLGSPAVNGIEDAMWEMNLRSGDVPEAGPFPERPGEEDCAYYVRTGFCRFGMTCRFNHPPNRKLAVAAARMKGIYPERIGQPECQYYLKTGTCKFGATCKFHHPRDKAGIEGRVLLNVLGYPLRQNEKECPYYLRTGHCKYGSTCKFNHPQPTNPTFSLRGSAIYPTIQSPSTAGQQSYPGALTNWHLSRASFVPSPRWQGPSNYGQLLLPQGVVSVTGWNTYAGQLASASSSEVQDPALGSSHYYGTSDQNDTMGATDQGSFSSYHSSTPFRLFALQKENVFPERPDQPECQFYMKTGDCKFGAVCRFHHPRERLTPAPDCASSMMGLPLRPILPSRNPWKLLEKLVMFFFAVLYAFFGLRLLYIAWRSDSKASQKKEMEEVEEKLEGGQGKTTIRRVFSRFCTPIFLESFILTFLAEWGGPQPDSNYCESGGSTMLTEAFCLCTLTVYLNNQHFNYVPFQLATHKNAIGVAVGATIGHTICTSIAVVGGSMLASKISQGTVATIGGLLFLGFSLSSYFYPPL